MSLYVIFLLIIFYKNIDTWCCWSKTGLPASSPAKIHLYTISRELQLKVYNHEEGKEHTFIGGGGEEVARAVVNTDSMAFQRLSPGHERSDNIIHDIFLKAKRHLLELVHDRLNLLCPSFPRLPTQAIRQLNDSKGMRQIVASKIFKFIENSPLTFFHLQFFFWSLSLYQAIFEHESLSHHLVLWCSINVERNQSEIAIHDILMTQD